MTNVGSADLDILKHVADDGDGFAKLLLGDDQRRSEADDVAVGRLGQEALFGHLQADVPCLDAILRLGNDGVEQALAADGLEVRRFDLGNFLAEDLAQISGFLGEVLVADDFEGGDSNFGGQRESAERRIK